MKTRDCNCNPMAKPRPEVTIMKPREEEPFLIGKALQRPDIDYGEAIQVVAKLLYMFGGYSNMVNSMMRDLVGVYRTNPDIYRHGTKALLGKILNCSEEMMKSFERIAGANEVLENWRDIVDIMEQMTEQDRTKLYFATDNCVMRCKAEPHELITHTIICYNFATELSDVQRAVQDAIDETMGGMRVRIAPYFDRLVEGMAGYLTDLHTKFVPREVFEMCKQTPSIGNGIDIVTRKMLAPSIVNDACSIQCQRFGFHQLDEDGETPGENPMNNHRKPWDKESDRILKTYFGYKTVEEIAHVLGRTEGAIKARAKALGIDGKTFKQRWDEEQERQNRKHNIKNN